MRETVLIRPTSELWLLEANSLYYIFILNSLYVLKIEKHMELRKDWTE